MQKSKSSALETALTVIALLGVVVAAWVAITGGARFSLLGLNVRMTDPYRPLFVAMAALAVRMFLGGLYGPWRDVVGIWRALTPRATAVTLALVIFTVGVANGSGVAGGADSYGYISQADLWLQGRLVTAQPDAARVPWPEGQWTFAPLGYRPSQTRDAIVPMYSPGFPLVLAAAKFIGGQCAIAVVVPFAAGVLILVTFAIGRKTVSDEVGAGAAWLMATSPVLLYMMMSPMSDVPAGVFWGLAVLGCLAGSRAGAVGGGLAAAAAVLIRPNLVHVGLVMAAWLAMRDFRLPEMRQRIVRPLLFVLPLAAVGIGIALLNGFLYGGATNSGYGSLSGIFDVSRLPLNLFNYMWWIVRSQTPLALLGLFVIFAPLPKLLKSREDIRGRDLLALMSAAVIVTYLLYLNFDVWWYLRFLLPMWFAICVGTTHLCAGRSGRSFTTIAKVILLCLGLYGLWFAQKEGVLDLGRNEQRYVNIAQLVRDTTEPNSIIITLQHSGSVRYYAGRTTLRYEVLGDRWLDRTITWLGENGFHPYILLDNPEHEPFKNKFGRRNVAGNLDMAIVFEYRDRYNTSTFLYDPTQPSKLASVPVIVAAPPRDTRWDCVPPAQVQSTFAMENARR